MTQTIRPSGPRVVIDAVIASDTDGRQGVYIGDENGFARVLLDRWQSVMLFLPCEVKRVN